MILSGHQPNYWPYPGLIGKICQSDKFMYVSNVQYEKKSWQKRNRLRTKNGWDYIQVPIISKGKFEQKIADVKIDNNEDWRSKHRKMISLLYSKAPYYRYYSDFLDDLYTRKWEKLDDLDIYIMNYILSEVNCKTEILYDKNYNFNQSKTGMLIEMCKVSNCDTYLSNLGSSAYVQIQQFLDNGLNHKYIDFISKPYKQQYYGFEPGLSILDMLMNCGSEETRRIVLDNSNYKFSELNEELVDNYE